MSWKVAEFKQDLPAAALQQFEALEAELETFKKERKQKMLQLESLDGILSKAQADNKAISKANDKLQHEVGDVLGKVREAELAIADHVKEIKAKGEIVDMMKSQADKTKARLSELEAESQSFETKWHAEQACSETLQQSAAKQTQEIGRLKEGISNLTAQLAKKREELSEPSAKEGELLAAQAEHEQTISRLESSLQKAADEGAVTQKMLESTNGTVQALNEQLERLQVDCRTWEEKCAATQEQLETATSAHSLNTQESESIRQLLAHKSSQMASLQEEFGAQSIVLETLRNQMADKENKLEEQNLELLKLHDLEELHASVQSKLERVTEEWKQERSDLETEINDLIDSTRGYETTMGNYENEMSKKDTEIGALRASIESISGDVAAAQEDTKEREAQIAALESQNEQTLAQLSLMEAGKVEALERLAISESQQRDLQKTKEDECAVLLNKISELTSRLEQFASEIASLSEANEASLSVVRADASNKSLGDLQTIRGLESQVEILQEQVTSLTAQLESSDIRTESVDAKLQQATLELLATRETLAQTERTSLETSGTLDNALKNIDALRQQLEDASTAATEVTLNLQRTLHERDEASKATAQMSELLAEKQSELREVQDSLAASASEVEQLQGSAVELERLLNQWKCDAHEASEKNTQLQKEINGSASQVTLMEAQLADAHVQIESLKEQIDKNIIAYDAVTTDLDLAKDAHECTMAEQRILMDSVRGELESLKWETESLRVQVDEKSTEILTLQTEMSDYKLSESGARNKIKDLKRSHFEEVSKLSEDLASLERELSDRDAQVVSLHGEVSEANRGRTETAQQVAQLKSEIVNLEQVRDDMQSRVDSIQAELEAKVADNETASYQISNLRAAHSALEVAMKDVNALKTEADAQIAEMRSYAEEQYLKLQQADGSIAALQQTIADLKQTNLSQGDVTHSTQMKLTQAEAEVEHLSKQLTDLSEQISETNQKLSASESDASEARSELDSVKDTVSKLEREVGGLSNSQNLLEQKLQAADNQILEQEKATFSAKQESSEFHSQLERSREEIRILDGKYQQTRTELTTAQQELVDRDEAFKSQEDNLLAAQNAISKLELECSVLKRENSGQQSEHNAQRQASASSISQLEMEAHDYRLQISKLKASCDEHEKRSNDLDSVINQQSTEVKKLYLQISKAETTLAVKEEENTSLGSKVAGLESEIQSLSKEIEVIKTEADEQTRKLMSEVQTESDKAQKGLAKADELTREIAILKSELEGLRVKSVGAEATRVDLEKTLLELQSLKIEVSRAVDEKSLFEMELATKTDEAKQLAEKLEKSQGLINAAAENAQRAVDSQLRNFERKLNDASANCTAYEEMLVQKSEEINKLKAMLESNADLQQHEEELKEMQQQLDEKSADLSELTDRCEDFREKNMKLERAIAAHKAKVVAAHRKEKELLAKVACQEAELASSKEAAPSRSTAQPADGRKRVHEDAKVSLVIPDEEAHPKKKQATQKLASPPPKLSATDSPPPHARVVHGDGLPPRPTQKPLPKPLSARPLASTEAGKPAPSSTKPSAVLAPMKQSAVDARASSPKRPPPNADAENIKPLNVTLPKPTLPQKAPLASRSTRRADEVRESHE